MLTAFSITASAQHFDWAKNMGGTSNDRGISITTDYYGNVFTTGRFSGTADFDPGPGAYTLTSGGGNDAFVTKFNASGQFVWATKIGGAGDDIGIAITIDYIGNVYASGILSTGAYISKLDPSGNTVWMKAFTGNVQSASLTTDISGNVYTTGTFGGTVDFDPGIGVFNLEQPPTKGPLAGFLSQLDSSGNFVWAKGIMPIMGYVRSNGISLDIEGNIYITGESEGAIDFDPDTIAVYTMPGSIYPGFVLKLDSAGIFSWAKNTGMISTAITIDLAGNIYLSGFYERMLDLDPGPGTYSIGGKGPVITKLDASGNFAWARLASEKPDARSSHGKSICVDALQNVYLFGSLYDSTDFNSAWAGYTLVPDPGKEVFMWKLDASGGFVSAARLSGSVDFGNYLGRPAAIDLSGNIYTTGYFSGTVDFDPGSGTANLVSAGLEDVCVSKFENCVLAVILQPSAQTANVGTDAQFVVIPSNPMATFQWQVNTGTGFADLSNGGAFSGVTTNRLKITSVALSQDDDSYRCILMVAGCATDTSDAASLTVTTSSGIDDKQISTRSFTVSPNPSAGIFSITCDAMVSKIEIMNILGETVYVAINTNGSASFNPTVNLSGHANGMYFVRVSSEANSITKKINLSK